MKLFKFLFIFFAFFFVISCASCFPIGVIEPDIFCIKPDRAGVLDVLCYSGSDKYTLFNAHISGQNFATIEKSEYLFFPTSNQNIPVFVNTTGVEQGFYILDFTFCPETPQEDMGMGIILCINSPVYVNVSENCAELPEPIKTYVEPYENLSFSPLIKTKTFKTAFNCSVLVLIALILFYLLFKNLVLKRTKK